MFFLLKANLIELRHYISETGQPYKFIPRIKQHPGFFRDRGVWNNELAMTYSHMGNPTLPSALRGFTSEF
uniref:hypothetical protein n=1 Tax=Acinetobacter seifertii TaxID=1530123 RepID=UPI001C07CC62